MRVNYGYLKDKTLRDLKEWLYLREEVLVHVFWCVLFIVGFLSLIAFSTMIKY